MWRTRVLIQWFAAVCDFICIAPSADHPRPTDIVSACLLIYGIVEKWRPKPPIRTLLPLVCSLIRPGKAPTVDHLETAETGAVKGESSALLACYCAARL